MQKILALTFGDRCQASSGFRVYQFAEPLRTAGIELDVEPVARFRDWTRARSYDVVLVQKRLLRTGRIRQLRRDARRLVYDVDDAIWEPHGRRHSWFTRWRTRRRLQRIVRLADQCIAANEVLAAHLRAEGGRVAVLPMALDERVWQRPPPRPPAATVRVGWAGHPVNLRYLEALEPALREVQRQSPEVEFVVFSGAPPGFRELRCRHLPFASGGEREAVLGFDIGLLPLPGGAFSEGKSPIKGLQYLACGIPCVASPLGATCEMFRSGETALFAEDHGGWIEGILKLVRDPVLRQRLGQQGRGEFEARHTLGALVEPLAGLLCGTSKVIREA